MVIYGGENGIDEGVELDGVLVHFVLFGLVEHRVFHFDVEAGAFGEFGEHFFEGGEGGLDEISAAVAFVTFHFEVARVFHAL